MAVYTVQDGHAHWVPVQLAARNGRSAWIRSGLQPGQTVIIYPPATLRDGQRIQPRRV
jgi:HlyD family secretion protein